MASVINIQAILIADLLSIILLVTVSVCSAWVFTRKSSESRILLTMCIVSVFTCILDFVCFWSDGQAGLPYRIAVYASNWLLFLANLILIPSWIFFLKIHVGITLHKQANVSMRILNIIGLILLLINPFTSVVFSIDDANSYHRGPFFWYYVSFAMIMMLYSLFLYLKARSSGSLMKFFPIWVFIIPLGCGVAIQSLMYGVSTMWPSAAIGITCVIVSLQNELLFRDTLTGLYNRFYMDKLREEMVLTGKGQITTIMLDLNRFKSINDTYGHSTGDAALKETAELLRKAVDTLGITIRYAGDEFIIILNTQDDAVVDDTIRRIHAMFEEFNRTSGRPYTLTVSAGHCKLDLSKQTPDAMINEVDKLLYENKREYYRTHDRRAGR